MVYGLEGRGISTAAARVEGHGLEKPTEALEKDCCGGRLEDVSAGAGWRNTGV